MTVFASFFNAGAKTNAPLGLRLLLALRSGNETMIRSPRLNNDLILPSPHVIIIYNIVYSVYNRQITYTVMNKIAADLRIKMNLLFSCANIVGDQNACQKKKQSKIRKSWELLALMPDDTLKKSSLSCLRCHQHEILRYAQDHLYR